MGWFEGQLWCGSGAEVAEGWMVNGSDEEEQTPRGKQSIQQMMVETLGLEGEPGYAICVDICGLPTLASHDESNN